MPRIAAEFAVAQALNDIGLNWAHFQEDHPDEAAVLLDAATMAEAYYDDGLEEAASKVLEAWDSDKEKSVKSVVFEAIEQLRDALPGDSEEQTDPSDYDLAAMSDAEAEPEHHCVTCGKLVATGFLPIQLPGPNPPYVRHGWSCGHPSSIQCGECNRTDHVACPICGCGEEHT